MKNLNILSKIFFLFSIIFISASSFAQSVETKMPQVDKLKETNSGLLMPASPLGMALFVFMLIITLAFAITRLKNEDLVRS